MRVRQEAEIEDQVRVRGDPVFETERNQANHHGGTCWIPADVFDQPPAKVVDVQLRRIDGDIRTLAQPRQAFALAADRCVQISVDRQSVRPPSLAEAPHQHAVCTVEKHNLDPVPRRYQPIERLLDVFQERSRTHIDAEPDPIALSLDEAEKITGERRREVVDAEEARILENA